MDEDKIVVQWFKGAVGGVVWSFVSVWFRAPSSEGVRCGTVNRDVGVVVVVVLRLCSARAGRRRAARKCVVKQ